MMPHAFLKCPFSLHFCNVSRTLEGMELILFHFQLAFDPHASRESRILNNLTCYESPHLTSLQKYVFPSTTGWKQQSSVVKTKCLGAVQQVNKSSSLPAGTAGLCPGLLCQTWLPSHDADLKSNWKLVVEPMVVIALLHQPSCLSWRLYSMQDPQLSSYVSNVLPQKPGYCLLDYKSLPSRKKLPA